MEDFWREVERYQETRLAKGKDRAWKIRLVQSMKLEETMKKPRWVG